MEKLLKFIWGTINTTKTNILILGFYNRMNIGDDLYCSVLPMIFKKNNVNINFHSMDDIKVIPSETNMIICGGGDIINDYFMDNAYKLLKNFTGPVYALSTGIPYPAGKKYLHLFDHVFVRNSMDYNLACDEIGHNNVTEMMDAGFYLYDPYYIPLPLPIHNSNIHIGLCLAQPYFWNNDYSEQLLESIANAVIKFSQGYTKTTIHLLAFNHRLNSPSECDYIINDALTLKLLEKQVFLMSPDKITIVNVKNVENPLDMLEYMKKLHLTICMRFHSIVFSLINKLKFVVLSATSKNNKLVNDVHHPYNYQISIDPNSGKTMSIDENKLYEMMNLAISNEVTHIPKFNYDIISDIILKKKLLNVPIRHNVDTFDNILFRCKKVLIQYLNVSESTYDSLLMNIGKFNLYGKKEIDLARLISYCITNDSQNPYVWGLSENLYRNDFKLYEAIEYIYQDNKKHVENPNLMTEYYPTISIERKVYVDIDSILKDDFKGLHRSGWAYALGGLMNLDASHRMKHGDILIDTYVDRTFHWGYDTLKSFGVLPYHRPWIGIIHHTFDMTYSEYNCVSLFQNHDFVLSLQFCKGLIVLTHYLASELRKMLYCIDMTNIPVFVVCHPMEMTEKMFTMDKYLNNLNKKCINIGAWLRNPYTIYRLELIRNDIQKCVLKGKHMNQCVRPDNLMAELQYILVKRENTHNISHDLQKNFMCRANYKVNKYCQGLFNYIKKNDESVEIIDHLSNDEYDDLLSKNIVFLDLIDCSAVNTVLECLVRNTPLIVNRHPAIEEILGTEYPGFYNNLIDASLIINSDYHIHEISHYLSHIDKNKYCLDKFVSRIQKIVLDLQHS